MASRRARSPRKIVNGPGTNPPPPETNITLTCDQGAIADSGAKKYDIVDDDDVLSFERIMD